MKAELDAHLAASDEPNRKNGSTPKRVKSPIGEFELQMPRDRVGRFEPQLVKKHRRTGEVRITGSACSPTSTIGARRIS